MFFEAKLMFSIMFIIPIALLIISAYEARINGLQRLQDLPQTDCALQKGTVGLVGISAIVICLITMLWRYA